MDSIRTRMGQVIKDLGKGRVTINDVTKQLTDLSERQIKGGIRALTLNGALRGVYARPRPGYPQIYLVVDETKLTSTSKSYIITPTAEKVLEAVFSNPEEEFYMDEIYKELPDLAKYQVYGIINRYTKKGLFRTEWKIGKDNLKRQYFLILLREIPEEKYLRALASRKTTHEAVLLAKEIKERIEKERKQRRASESESRKNTSVSPIPKKKTSKKKTTTTKKKTTTTKKENRSKAQLKIKDIEPETLWIGLARSTVQLENELNMALEREKIYKQNIVAMKTKIDKLEKERGESDRKKPDNKKKYEDLDLSIDVKPN